MALSTRELLLVLKARDEMSAIIDKNSAALQRMGAIGETTSRAMAIGTGLVATGTALKNLGRVALDFGQDSLDAAKMAQSAHSLIATQAQNLNLVGKDIAAMIEQVGRARAVPLDDLRSSLFEILSTVETDVPGAIEILDALGIAGVAAQTGSTAFAGAGTASLNAFGLEAGDTLRVLDAMFRAVEQGQGSYDNFAAGFASAIPSAQAFNQTMEDTFAAVALVTKATGLTEAEAGTAVARAFDLFKKTDIRKNLAELGVQVVDSQGDFRSIVSVLGELQGALGGLSPAAREAALEDIFGANIRAFRFLNPTIENLELFNSVVKEVNAGLDEGSGILGAYAIVSRDAAAAEQQFQNNLQLVKEQVGAVLLPAYVQLLEIGNRLIGMWEGLSESTQETIIKFVMIVSTVAVVVGTIMTFVGGLLLAKAMLAFFGVTLGAVIATAGVALLVFAAIAAAAYLIYANWDTVGPIFHSVKDAVIAFGQAAWLWIRETAIPALQEFAAKVAEIAEIVWAFVTGTIVPFVAEVIAKIMELKDGILSAVDFILAKWDEFVAWLNENILPGLLTVIETIKIEFNSLKEAFNQSSTEISAILTWLKDVFVLAFDFILIYMQFAWEGIKLVFSIGMLVITDVWVIAWNFISDYVVIIWNLITGLLDGAIKIISNIIKLGLALIRGDWGAAWDAIKGIAAGAWTTITAIIRAGWELVKLTFRTAIAIVKVVFTLLWESLKLTLSTAWTAMKESTSSGWESVKEFFRLGKTFIENLFSNASTLLKNAGRDIISGLWNGAKEVWERMKGWLTGIGNIITSIKGPPEKDKVLLVNNGRLIMKGFHKGLSDGWSDVERYLSNLPIEQQMHFGVAARSNVSIDHMLRSDDDAKTDGLIDAIRELSAKVSEMESGVNVDGDLLLTKVGGKGTEDDDDDLWDKIERSGM